ncbi:DUF1636 domain-containing protein [Methylopila sp. 73B]|uniref:DUF1636 family protein n=1 Tax=Methylopila sp. 73B TaxID=1120792 RepID=UPI00036C253F|nr:DUF1636 domain-containing protein [Methylopila sp. 73B]
MSMPVTLTICRTCRPEGAPEDVERPGAVLLREVVAAVALREAAATVEVKAIACLSACSRACSATVSGEAKFGYVVGNLSPLDAADLVGFALAHAESADGVPSWRARPQVVRKNTIARLPPHGVSHPLVEEPASAAVDEVQEGA